MQNEDGDIGFEEGTEGDVESGAEREETPRARPQSRPQPERRRAPSNADDVLIDELKARAQRAGPRLRECLLGTLLIELTNGKKYGFDWRQGELLVAPLAGDLGGVGPADCTIRLSEDNLLRIANGDLNPQVGMLSDKIKVDGKVSFAVYFFNLIAPRVNV